MSNNFLIFIIIEIICLFYCHLLFLQETSDELEEKKFCAKVNTFFNKLNYTKKEMDPIINAFSNRFFWKEPSDSDALFGFLSFIIDLAMIINCIIIVLILIFININLKKGAFKFLRINISLGLSVILMLIPISVFYNKIKEPIYLEQKYYSTNLEEFNNLIKDKISELNYRTNKMKISFSLSIVSLIILIIGIIFVNYQKFKKTRDDEQNIEKMQEGMIN